MQHNGSVLFYEDPAKKDASIAFAHILRDKDENIVTINNFSPVLEVGSKKILDSHM